MKIYASDKDFICQKFIYVTLGFVCEWTNEFPHQFISSHTTEYYSPAAFRNRNPFHISQLFHSRDLPKYSDDEQTHSRMRKMIIVIEKYVKAPN